LIHSWQPSVGYTTPLILPNEPKMSIPSQSCDYPLLQICGTIANSPDLMQCRVEIYGYAILLMPQIRRTLSIPSQTLDYYPLQICYLPVGRLLDLMRCWQQIAGYLSVMVLDDPRLPIPSQTLDWNLPQICYWPVERHLVLLIHERQNAESLTLGKHPCDPVPKEIVSRYRSQMY
jgi:hypothetical protein